MSCQCPSCTLHREIGELKKKFGEEALGRFDKAYLAFFNETEHTSLKLFGAERALQIISEDFTDETRQRVVRDYLEKEAGRK